MKSEPGKIPPPPGLIASFTAGFNAIANNTPVIILPVMLDLFLWLGPHLRLKQLIEPLIGQFSTLTAPNSSVALEPALVQEIWTQFLDNFNLFATLRTFPVGITSLMSGRMPIQTPFGTPANIEVGSFSNALGWWLLLVIGGWIIGGLYFHWVSGVALKAEKRSLSQSLRQVVLLSVIWLALLFFFGLPAFLVFSILTLINPLLAKIVLLIFALLSLWLVLPVFFSPHGIFTYQQNAWLSILNSLRMIRFTLPTSGLFLLGAIIISQGLDFLWRTPQENSWLTLVGIAGHAFISTAILATSFIYYRDVNAWLQIVTDQLQKQTTSVRA
ncbi:MAG: hypothetical protein QMD04_07665 [Anaerolineales bacterium]|nr:hypothetical protein [Anaerolineales bacterium]